MSQPKDSNNSLYQPRKHSTSAEPPSESAKFQMNYLASYLLEQLETQRDVLYEELFDSLSRDRRWCQAVIREAMENRPALEALCDAEPKPYTWDLPQGSKVTHTEAIDSHARQCLTYIAYLKVFIRERLESLSVQPFDSTLDSITQYVLHWLQMISYGYQHVAAIKVLHNHSWKSYDFARRKGGQVKAQRVTKSETQQLIKTLIKVLLVTSQPSRHELSQVRYLADRYAREIMSLQEKFPLFRFMGYDALFAEVLSTLGNLGIESPPIIRSSFERHVSLPISRPERSLSQLQSIERSAEKSAGWQEGFSQALQLTLEHKFHKLSSSHLDLIQNAQPLQLVTWLHRAQIVESIETVFSDNGF